MSKRQALLEAASRIVVLRGLSQLTLEAVAEEAGVSKGGLLYHFPSKDMLVEAMNEAVIARFREEIERECLHDSSFSRAYARATLHQLADKEFLQLNASLLAAIGSSPGVLSAWAREYDWIAGRLEAEQPHEEDALILRLVCDGLWFSRMFGLSPVTEVQQEKLLSRLLGSLGLEPRSEPASVTEEEGDKLP
ncbi:TetR family transcriptional regulator [Paenibacillus sp. J31TS4]|uniref:TetR/AcrR family transcriptional regulator n=1 Tax=Paenibacillus sp. J31TS4 TaxID=2807195 RepID=UPI001B2B2BA4|nr:TetR/AcrR family transcriptional regulator [Paenibacillus sp. J31TS4]GIP37177.1 TetR family transcriptional regulator [Paenibacillus sp. J31TS4]